MGSKRWAERLRERREDVAFVILAIIISGGVMGVVQLTWVYQEQRVINEVLETPLADIHIEIFPPCLFINQNVRSVIENTVEDSELFLRWKWSIHLNSGVSQINSSVYTLNLENDWLIEVLEELLVNTSMNFNLTKLDKGETVIPLSVAEEARVVIGDTLQITLDDPFRGSNLTATDCTLHEITKTVNLTVNGIYATKSLFTSVLRERGIEFPLFINHEFAKDVLNTSQMLYNSLDVLFSKQVNNIAIYQSKIDSYSWTLHNELFNYAGNVTVVSYPHSYSVSRPSSPLPLIKIISPRQILLTALTDSAFHEPRINFWSRMQ